MAHSPVSALILAAGKGTRMKSGKAKVLHEAFFAPMVHHVLDATTSLDLDDIVVVVGHQKESVQAALSGYVVSFVSQDVQLGTGHAVMAARDILAPRGGSVLILCGDTPLIRTATLKDMLAAHECSSTVLTVMTTELDDPTHYGRIIRKGDGSLQGIVEEKDATPEQRAICEVNAGIYCVDVAFLFSALEGVGTDNQQGEVYLTDIVAIANRSGLPPRPFLCVDKEEILGVNSRVELAEAHACLQRRRNLQLMADGVTLLQPETVNIEKTVLIGNDSVIAPHVRITGNTVIGQDCFIDSFSDIRDCRIGDGARIGSLSFLEGRSIVPGEIVLPRS